MDQYRKAQHAMWDAAHRAMVEADTDRTASRAHQLVDQEGAGILAALDALDAYPFSGDDLEQGRFIEGLRDYYDRTAESDDPVTQAVRGALARWFPY